MANVSHELLKPSLPLPLSNSILWRQYSYCFLGLYVQVPGKGTRRKEERGELSCPESAGILAHIPGQRMATLAALAPFHDSFGASLDLSSSDFLHNLLILRLASRWVFLTDLPGASRTLREWR